MWRAVLTLSLTRTRTLNRVPGGPCSSLSVCQAVERVSVRVATIRTLLPARARTSPSSNVNVTIKDLPFILSLVLRDPFQCCSMARTRLQAAQKPEPAVEQHVEPSSGEESTTPAAAKRRRRPDPDAVSTLRPSREKRPEVLLSPSKRSKTTAQVDNDSPSAAKKRRRESGIKSSNNKRSKASTSENVNPVVLQVMNEFKQKRSTFATRASKTRRLTVDLPQSGARSSRSRNIPQPTVSETATEQEEEVVVAVGEQEQEEHAGNVEELPEAEPEQEVFLDQAASEELIVDERQYVETPEPDAEQDGEHLPKYRSTEMTHSPTGMAQTGNGRKHVRIARYLPPRSGQGDLPAGGTQPVASTQHRAPRKSQPRVPEAAFGELPGSEQTGPSVSKSVKRGRRTFQRSPTVAVQPEESTEFLGGVHRNDKSSSKRKNAQESIVIEDDDRDDDYEETEEEDEVDYEVEENSDGRVQGPSSRGPARDSLFHQAPSITEGQFTVQVPSKEIRSICHLMGQEGWTSKHNSWVKCRGPSKSSSGKDLVTDALRLREEYRTAPQAWDLARQNTFLQGKAELTEEHLAAITRHVDQICRKCNATIQGANKKKAARERGSLKGDLTKVVIPLLVLLLREFFFLGSTSQDEEGNRTFPGKGGIFTATTLQFLIRTVGWITRLAPIVRREAELSGTQATSSDDEEGQNMPSPGKDPLDPVRERAAEKTRHQIALDEKVGRLSRSLWDALDELDEKANRAARRKERIEREAETKAERDAEAREAREKSQRQYEAMVASTQRFREGPGPLSELWIKDQALAAERAAESQREMAERRRELAEREREGSPQLGSGVFDESPARQPTRRDRREETFPPIDRLTPARRNGASTARPWRVEETKALLGLLKEGGPPDYHTWAEAMGRRVDEVRQEAKLLTISARGLAKDKGYNVPRWAVE